MYKIGMISLGCPKNQVDAERMLALLDKNEFEIADCYEGVDAVIINTCGFIDDAKREAIENILDMAQLKEEGIVKKLLLQAVLLNVISRRFSARFPRSMPLSVSAQTVILPISLSVLSKAKIFMKCLIIPCFLLWAKDF